MKVVIEVDKGMVTAAYADGDVELVVIDHDAKEVDEIGVNTDPEAMAEALGEVKDYTQTYLRGKC